MILTRENYHSREANEMFFSSSQIKDFKKCENLAVYNIENSESDISKDCFKQGHFGHAWNEGPEFLEKFKAENRDIYTKKGELKQVYKDIEASLKHLEKDKFVMSVLSGKKEVIFTSELFGHKCKIMIDSWNRFKGSIADLKLIKSLTDRYWCSAERQYKSFIDFYNYDMSMAFYCEIERLAVGKSDYCFPFLVAVTKEKTPNKDVIKFADTQKELREFVAFHLEEISEKIDRWANVKAGKEQPDKCGNCVACLQTKMITEATSYKNYLIN